MARKGATRSRHFRSWFRHDSGVSIIEVLAATLIFLVISVGVAQATVTAIRLSADQRHRITALSLASSEIDLVRAQADPFAILDREVTRTIDNVDYTIHRETSWVSSTGLDIPCGAGGTGNLQYKRVNVRVTWAGQIQPISPVSSDTIVAPNGRLNDPGRGTINVLVVGASGTGAVGVSVEIQPADSSAEALDTQPAETNAEGCTYAVQVVPGSYTVRLFKSGYISADQQTTPSAIVEVAAGETINASFTYDAAADFAVSFPGGADASRASNFEVTYINTYGASYKDDTSTLQLFPWSSGYRAIAGHYVAPDGTGAGGCPAVDPGEWTEGTVGSISLAAGAANEPVASGSISVPMGVVELAGLERRHYIKAVSVSTSALPGQPTCEVEMTYTFGRISDSSSIQNRTILLPYGTWKLYYSRDSGVEIGRSGTSALRASQIITTSNVAAQSDTVTDNQITLDPRSAAS